MNTMHLQKNKIKWRDTVTKYIRKTNKYMPCCSSRQTCLNSIFHLIMKLFEKVVIISFISLIIMHTL
jgi:hypothetical protein